MSGAFPIDPAKIAELSRLSAQINAGRAPAPITPPPEMDDAGRVILPVPEHLAIGFLSVRKAVSAELHLGLTLQWAPWPDGALIEFRGGVPDGDETRDAGAVFLTATGLKRLAKDLLAIAAAVDAAA